MTDGALPADPPMISSAATPADLDVTVIIPTFNGEKYLARLLAAVAGQDFEGSVEVLVIDSGSTDATLDIVHKHPDVRLHEIPNEQFGHGRTRNLAAKLARGRVLAFLTQDAIPATTGWLSALVAPLDPQAADAVAVLGRQHPRRDCFPLQKYEIETVFARFGSQEVALYERGETTPTPAEMDVLGFYSDVNSATRRAFLLEVIPYRDLKYSEDMAFGRDVIEAGYRKAYAPDGVVEHSNDLTLREYGKRMFDETLALRLANESAPTFSSAGQILRCGYGILRDCAKICRDRDYSAPEKARWLLVNPAFHVSRWRSYRRAVQVQLDDRATIEAHSLEHERVSRVTRN